MAAATLSPREKRIMDLFTIVTGGATGADTLAEELALEWGMKVKLCLTPHHHRVTSHKETGIAFETLRKQDVFVERALERLKRRKSHNPFVSDLLARNWSIVKEVEVLVAYGEFEDNTRTTLKGGTGVTVQMCVDHNREFPSEFKTVYVFDEKLDKWFELSDEKKESGSDVAEATATHSHSLGYLEFVELSDAPHLFVTTGVVGSRTLGQLGRKQMRDQFNSSVAFHLYPHRMSEEAYWEEVEKTRLTYEKLTISDDAEKPETK